MFQTKNIQAKKMLKNYHRGASVSNNCRILIRTNRASLLISMSCHPYIKTWRIPRNTHDVSLKIYNRLLWVRESSAPEIQKFQASDVLTEQLLFWSSFLLACMGANRHSMKMVQRRTHIYIESRDQIDARIKRDAVVCVPRGWESRKFVWITCKRRDRGRRWVL
jgi:hypothetical protein